ncbi:MAG: ATP-grasp domain-containing protein [Candidatus Nomurabacteria bacterium]|nr:ATP-grasp domain-containing protein [Candidatus Nomurabacteria bacterium]
MNKKKLVFWKRPTGDPVIDNFSRNPEYHEFFRQCNEVFEFRIVNNRENYIGNGVFKNVCLYKDGRISQTAEEFKTDVIYQFKKLTDETFDNAVPVVNTLAFKSWCGDKWNQYQLLSEFMSKTFLIEKEEDLLNYLPQITTDKAVIKPRSGQKGDDVVVFDKKFPAKLNLEILKKKGYLLQEFSDTNVNIPNVVSGTHDIKLITIDDSVFANLRTPDVKDSDVCTYDSPYTEIDIHKLPETVLAFHKQVKEKVNQEFPGQLYTVDIGITEKGPIIFELNNHTAFPYIHFDYAQDFFKALIKHLQLM